MTLRLRPKEVYGRMLYYPHCRLSQSLAEIVGVKAFSEKHLPLILKIYDVKYVENKLQPTKS